MNKINIRQMTVESKRYTESATKVTNVNRMSVEL